MHLRKKLSFIFEKMIKRIYSLAFSDDRSLKYVRNRKIREMSNRLIPDDSFIFSMKRGLIHKKRIFSIHLLLDLIKFGIISGCQIRVWR